MREVGAGSLSLVIAVSLTEIPSVGHGVETCRIPAMLGKMSVVRVGRSDTRPSFW